MRRLKLLKKLTTIFQPIYQILQGVLLLVKQKKEARQNILEALALHLEGLKEDGLTIPLPASEADYVVAQ